MVPWTLVSLMRGPIWHYLPLLYVASLQILHTGNMHGVHCMQINMGFHVTVIYSDLHRFYTTQHPPCIFSMDLCIGDRVFYTHSNGLRPHATVVGTAEDGLLHLEYYQDGWRVVHRQCKMESISFAIPSSHSPPDCPPSPLPNT